MEKNDNADNNIIAEDPLHEWMPMVCSDEATIQKPILVTSKRNIKSKASVILSVNII